jgi:hypothetical protein
MRDVTARFEMRPRVSCRTNLRVAAAVLNIIYGDFRSSGLIPYMTTIEPITTFYRGTGLVSLAGFPFVTLTAPTSLLE